MDDNRGKTDNGGERVTIYSTTYCGYCRAAEDLLRRHDIPFEKIDVTGNCEVRASLVERAHGRRTVPVIFFGDEVIGGYVELAALIRSGEFQRRFGRAEAA